MSIALGMTFVGLGITGYYHHQQLLAHGANTSGQVTHRTQEITSHYADGLIYTGKTNQYFLDYTYAVNGTEYPNKGFPVSEETWTRAATDIVLPIRYLPENPADHEIEWPSEQGNAASLPFICLVPLGLSLAFAWRVWNKRPKPALASPGRRKPASFARR
jgi:hypothetical protein